MYAHSMQHNYSKYSCCENEIERILYFYKFFDTYACTYVNVESLSGSQLKLDFL